MTRAPSDPPVAREAAMSALRVAAWGICVYFAARLLGVWLEETSVAAAAGQAVAVEWGMGRVGVAWSDPSAPIPSAGAIVKRALRGVGLATAVAAAIAVSALALGLASIARARVDAGSLVIGAVTSGLLAMRDEIALHGLVMRVMVHSRRNDLRLLACGLTSAGSALGESTPSASSVLAQAFAGVALGALWVQDRGAWKAWGAHTALRFAFGAVLAGSVWDVRAHGIAGGDGGLATSWLGVAVLGATAAGAAWYVLVRAPRSAREAAH